jgi:hypothetical protein
MVLPEKQTVAINYTDRLIDEQCVTAVFNNRQKINDCSKEGQSVTNDTFYSPRP